MHFSAESEKARDYVGDVLAPKKFWGDFVQKDDTKAGGLRSLTMEQASIIDGARVRLDGRKGWIHVKVEPSLLPALKRGIFRVS